MMPKFQAEMQCASYLPVCGTTKDLPVGDSGKSLLQNDNDQMQIDGHGYNFLYSPCNTSQYQDQEKEMLKKIMLQHEAAFKHQVSELHRLYKRQRELMDEIKMRELSTNNKEGKTSKSNPILSPKLSESDQSCHWPLGTFKFQSASNFDAGKRMQAGPNTSIIASSLKDPILLPSSSKKITKRTFDLELPADEYIDCEEERFEEGIVSGVSKVPDYPPKDLSAICHQKDLKLSICKDQLNLSEGYLFGTNLIPSITKQADLNKTFQEGTLYSRSRLPLDTNMEKPHLEHSFSQKPNTAFQFQTKEIDCIQVGKGLETRSESVHLEKVSRQHEHASLNLLVSATKPESSSVPSHRKSVCTSRSTPVATRALPYFDTPASLSTNATLSIGNSWLHNKVCLSRNSICDPRSPIVGSLQNSFLPRLEYWTSRTGPHSSTILNLNAAGVKSANEVDSSSMFSSHFSNLTNSLEKVRATHGNMKLEGTIRGLHWPSENVVPSGNTDNVKESLSQDLGLRPPKSFLMSSSDVEPKWHGTSDNFDYASIHGSFDNSQIAGDQLSKLQPNLSEDKVADNYEKIGLLDRRSAQALTVSKTKWSAQGELLKNGVNCKCPIDLNSSLNEDGSAQVEVEMKNAADNNLEPPVSPENKESSPPRGNSVEKQLTKFVELTEQGDRCQKDLAVVAAEVLVLISSTGFQLYLDNAPSKPFETSSPCLEWFAGVVSSAAYVLEEENETVPGGIADSNHSELLTDGLNNFAAIPPQVKEIKLEDYCCNSTGKKKRIGSAASPSQPKRRRTRTKSQKEIQGEILPCLMSPSRQEVSREIHTISGLVENEAKTRFEKKKSSKSERQRGKKHSSIPPSTVVERPRCSSLKQQTDDTEPDSLEDCLPIWGRKNKRKNGQRCPAPNLALI